MSHTIIDRLPAYALGAALVAALCAPLLALAWFATAGGAEMGQSAVATAWAGPLRRLAGGLLTFASPDTVYTTYSAVMAASYPAIPLVAWRVRSARPAGTRPERIGWRIALTGYCLFAGALLVEVLALVVGLDALADVVFLAGMLPGLLIGLVGSTILGTALLRAGFRPRISAWLLTLAIPLWIVGGFVLGHNSFGVVPLFIAWAVAARSAAAQAAVRSATARPDALPSAEAVTKRRPQQPAGT